jgi:outer membrane protein OmpA-like peptidoglycan-associated protein
MGTIIDGDVLPYGDDDRLLTGREQQLIKDVFGITRLPPFSKIRIRNGISPSNTPITFPNYSDGTYNISVGQELFDRDLTTMQSDRETLVHEMVHVWQYYHGTLTRKHGTIAHIHRNIAGKLGFRGDDYLYEYDITKDSWNDMGFEGQAYLVEQWYHDGRKSEDEDKRICFIKKVLYEDNAAARYLKLADLCELPIGPDEPIRVSTKDDSFVMILKGDVLFDFDKSDIKPASVTLIDKAAKNIKAIWRRGTVIRINGYTDNVGTDDYNNRLSERRARAVANSLSLHGVEKSAIKPSGFGKASPVAPNNDASGRAKNRRVEIFLTRS